MAAAMCYGALGGALVGLLESARYLVSGAAHYAGEAAALALMAATGYALLGTLLAALSATLAWALWRPTTHYAAAASTCAGLGAVLGLVGFIATRQVGASLLVPAVFAATLGCLVLRELLAWLPWLARRSGWGGALAVAVLGNVVLVFTSTSSAASKPVSRQRPNVLLVTLDTLRADHLGCYGATDAITPQLDAFALESALFEDTTAQANTTAPSHLTMLTGLYPLDHGVMQNGMRIPNGVPTMPEVLADEGYDTAGVISGFPLKDQASGLAARFGHYDDDLIAWTWMPEPCTRLRLVRIAIQLANSSGFRVMRADRPAGEVVDRALAWLDRREDSRPWFLWVHCYDPHAPYTPPREYARMHAPDQTGEQSVNWYRMSTRQRRGVVDDPEAFAHALAMYRAEITYADAQVGRLFEHLKSSGVWNDTLIAVTADHGEGLGEHGYYFDHGKYLTDTELHVPLILRLPIGTSGSVVGAGQRIATQTRLLDLAPTLLEALQVDVPRKLNGASLVPLMSGDRETDPRSSVAIGDLEGNLSGYDLDGRKRSLRSGGYKLIWTSDYWLDSERIPEKYEFYDVAKDPLERDNLYDADAESQSRQGAMERQLEAWRRLPAAGERGELDAETEAALRSLGYL